MIQSTQQFVDLLIEKGIKYTHSVIEDTGKDKVTIIYSGDNIPRIEVFFYFNVGGEDASIRVYNLVQNIPPEKTMNMITVANDMNIRYRFAKFCFDKSDSSLQMEMDVSFRSCEVGEICFELLQRAISICDDTYTQFMKALWS